MTAGHIDEVLIAAAGDRLRAAAISGGELIEVVDEPRSAVGATGSVYLGRVVRRMSGMGAVFVDVGLARPVLLDTGDDMPDEGSPVVVQIVEAARGDKSARASRRIALEGRFVVLIPGGKGVSVSRRILDRKTRERLTEIVKPPGAGLIIRSAAEEAPAKAVASEIATLHATWIAIKAALDEASPPFCAFDDGDGIARILRRFTGPRLPLLVFDDALIAKRAGAIAETLFGETPQVEVERQRGALFERNGVGEALASAELPAVRLPSGGRVTIETTTALTAIDVDTGEAADAGDAPLRIDVEAAAEIARQLRWRNIGGLVVVDFVRLAGRSARGKLEAALREAVKSDPVPVQLLGWTPAGLFELTRQRSRAAGAD